ncbi:uncharacterized GMC-type oxidoreductase Mb1310 [Trichonephila clavipes]|nr:uncharacterized GMC-type oxidoreductase Mb1310 [Trichonephila clavipes]
MRAGQRYSAAKAYLAPNDHKENLDIVSGAFVKKIIINNFQALGVVYDFEGKTREVRAYKEVILSAGTVNTAQLLMLSGIGPSEELAKHNIRVKADLPVGKNMQDHWAAMLAFELSDDITPLQNKQVDESNIKQYISSKTGVLSSVQGVAVLAFLDKDDPKGKKDYPDYQLYFWEGATGPAKDQLRIKPEVIYIFCSSSFDVKDAPRTDRPVVENVNKITEIIEVDRHVSSRSIAQELKNDHKTVLNPLRKIGLKKEAPCLGDAPINTKKHDGWNFHLRRFGQTEGNRPIS